MHNRPAHACIGVSVTLAPKKEAEQKRETPALADPPRRKTRKRGKKREPQREHTRPKTDAAELYRQNKNK